MTLFDPAVAAGTQRDDTARTLLAVVHRFPPETRLERLRELTSDAATIALVERMLGEAQAAGDALPADTAGHVRDPWQTELDVGDVLGAWRLVECLASGGMGTVFVAERADGLYDHRVAIKLLHGSPEPAIAERLADERRLLAQLQHPGIARLYDGGTTPGGQPYLVMEYVQGVPLDRYCREQSLGLDARIALFRRICRAVEAAHRQLVVHCDLKPGNVLVRQDGEPVLLDFGIARALGGRSDGAAGFCTPAYASPELLARGQIGTQSDVFSLGVLLIELLALRRPPRDSADAQQPVPAPSALAGEDVAWRRRLRGDLDAIAAKACAIDPDARYGSVAELDEDLARALGHRPVRARAGGPVYRGHRLLRRRWREAAVLAVLAGTSVVFVGQLQNERDNARREARTAEQVSDLLLSAFEKADPKHRGEDREATARDVLDAGAAALAGAAIDDPVVLARMHEKLGTAYHNLGHADRAQPMMLDAVAGYLDPEVRDPLSAARVLSEVAVLRNNHDDKPGAIEAARQSLALREQAKAPPLEVADSLNSLGLALIETDNAEARRTLEHALALRRRHAGEPSIAVAAVLHNLGQLARNTGDWRGAEGYYREALRQKKALGLDRDGSYTNTLENLARALTGQGRLKEAATVLRQSLELARTLYRDGGHLAKAYNEAASTLHDLGEWPEAAKHYREAERLWAAAAGDQSVDFAVALNNRSSLDEDRGALTQAEAGFRRSLAIRRTSQPPDSPVVARATFNLARVLVAQGKLREAGALIEPMWALWQAKQTDGNPATAGFRLVRAQWLLASGKPQQALGEVEAAERVAESMPPHRRPHLHRVRADIAAARGDRAAEAEQRRLALAGMAGALGVDHVETAKLRLAYARVLHANGQNAAARTQLEQAAPVLAARLAPEAPQREQLAALRVALGGGTAIAAR